MYLVKEVKEVFYSDLLSSHLSKEFIVLFVV